MTQHDNCSKSKAKTMLENKIWAQNSNFWNLNIYPQISVFLLSPSHCYQDRKMKTRGWSPTEFVWRLYQHFLLKMAPMTKELQCFHIKWTHCMRCIRDRVLPIWNQLQSCTQFAVWTLVKAVSKYLAACNNMKVDKNKTQAFLGPQGGCQELYFVPKLNSSLQTRCKKP